MDEILRIRQRADTAGIGGVNIWGISYISLDSNMNERYDIFLENLYHECTHSLGKIIQQEIDGYKVEYIINEYFTDLQAKKAGGFTESKGYIPPLVEVLESIEEILDPSRELFTQAYVEGNFSAIIEKITELTNNPELATKLTREIVEMVITTHNNIVNGENVFEKNESMKRATNFPNYLKEQIQNGKLSENSVATFEEIEMVDESTIGENLKENLDSKESIVEEQALEE
jgi:hypothetical protein